jgi:DNA-binding transcriptional ArsR family regulator
MWRAKPSEIARAVGRSVPRVSNVLGALRLADVVRYDSDGKRNYYRLKHPREIREVLAALSRLVEAVSKPPATASHCIISTFSELRKDGGSLRTQIQTIITS